MSTEATAPAASTEPDWDEERWAAGRPFLASLIEHVPGDDASLSDRLRALDFAAARGEELAERYPTEAPGASARALLDALRAVRLRQPQALPDPKPAPQSVRAAARLASQLADDPALAASVDVGLLPAIDLTLGGPGRPLAEYHGAVELARQTLAEACEERLSRIPTEWRRQANAPNRAERDERRLAATHMEVN